MEILTIEHDSKTALQLTKDYCLRSSSLDIQKKGMEFLYMNGYCPELTKMIEKNKKSDNPSNQTWGEVYQAVFDRKAGTVPPQVIIQKLDKIETDEPELISIIEISKVICYVEMHMFSALADFLDHYQQWFSQVKDPAFLSYLNIRLELLLMYYYLSKNLVILSRRSANRLLHEDHISPYIKVSAHTHLGFSYMFDSYAQTMTHMQKAMQIAYDNNYDRVIDVFKNRNIPFIAAHFNQADNITSNDKSEQAHLEIAKGNHERAIEILNELPLDTPFQLYYMGKAKQDKKLLCHASNQFIEQRSDYFFSRLPLSELAKMA
jgi:hypothetical protein